MVTNNNGPLIDVQLAYAGKALVPHEQQLSAWVRASLPPEKIRNEMTIRIVEHAESQQLNNDYRNKNKPTNVLSFPSDIPEFIINSHSNSHWTTNDSVADDTTPDSAITHYLGDLVICAEVVCQEASEQDKTTESHWAHMVVHGTLHLLGYDHIEDHDAEAMEALEIRILATLGYANPYETA